MRPSQPGTQTGTLPYNRTLFKCTGQGREISAKDTCTFERAPLRVSEQRPLLAQAAKSYTPFQKVLYGKLLDLYFCLHGGWLFRNLQPGQSET